MNAVSISKENATKIKGLHTFFSSIDLQNGSKISGRQEVNDCVLSGFMFLGGGWMVFDIVDPNSKRRNYLFFEKVWYTI